MGEAGERAQGTSDRAPEHPRRGPLLKGAVATGNPRSRGRGAIAPWELARGAPRSEYSIIATFEIRPHALVSSARHARKDTFVQLLHGAPLLLIPVRSEAETDVLSRALLDGLDACASGTGEPIPASRDGLPFSTATMPGEGERRGSLLARMTTEGLLYVVILHKRPGSRTLSEHRICVGRSYGNDIVLRAPSVSKLHAWFARDEEQQYFVVDAGSHNGTRVRDMVSEPKRPMQVDSGDVVLFGSVEATFCTAADFWEVLAAAPR
jgi:hypothetical protein